MVTAPKSLTSLTHLTEVVLEGRLDAVHRHSLAREGVGVAQGALHALDVRHGAARGPGDILLLGLPVVRRVLYPEGRQVQLLLLVCGEKQKRTS